MKTTVTVNSHNFHRAFEDANRTENFSYEGLNALLEYLEQYEEDTGEEIELDVIALCCEYSEFKNLADFQAQYSEDYETLEDIENHTIVIRIDIEENEDGIEDGSFIIQNF